MQTKCALTIVSGVLLLTGGCMHSPAEKSQPPKPAYTEHHSVTGANATAPATPAQPRAPQSGDLLTRMGSGLAAPARNAGVHHRRCSSMQPVVWNDSSLGCPQPGEFLSAGPDAGRARGVQPTRTSLTSITAPRAATSCTASIPQSRGSTKSNFLPHKKRAPLARGSLKCFRGVQCYGRSRHDQRRLPGLGVSRVARIAQCLQH